MFEVLDENKPLRDILSSYNIFLILYEGFLECSLQNSLVKALVPQLLRISNVTVKLEYATSKKIYKKMLKFTKCYGSDSEVDFAPC